MAGATTIIRPNTIEFADYGFSDSQFTPPSPTNTVLQNRAILAGNIKIIIDKMASSAKWKYQSAHVRIDQTPYPNLFSSIVSGAFADRGGIGSNMTVDIDPRGRTNQDPTITFKQSVGNASTSGASVSETFLVAGLETTPKLVRAANYKQSIIATEFYNNGDDALNVGVDLKTILQNLQNKRVELAKSADLQFLTTGASFPNLWNAIKNYLGISAGNASAINVEVEWSRSELTTFPTNYTFTQTDTRLVWEVSAYLNTSNVFDLKTMPRIAPLDAVKRYNFVVPAGNWANNSDIILGQTTAGTSGITAPGTLDANIRSLSFVGTADVQQNGVFSEFGNPNTNGLFKTNNVVPKNFDLTLRFNITSGSYQDMAVVLEKFDGTAWVPLETRKIWRSNDGIVENAVSFTTFSNGATDQFNTNSFRIRLRNTSGGTIAIPAHTMQLTFRGVI